MVTFDDIPGGDHTNQNPIPTGVTHIYRNTKTGGNTRIALQGPQRDTPGALK